VIQALTVLISKVFPITCEMPEIGGQREAVKKSKNLGAKNSKVLRDALSLEWLNN